MSILTFQGSNRWLSNFAPCSIFLSGRKYRSVEHAYMSAKSKQREWKLFCQITKNPAQVKRASKSIELRPNWEQIKIKVMRACLIQKYSQSPYREKLLSTKGEVIQEGNWWHDTFWGVDLVTGVGRNILGLEIMKIRDTL